MGTFVFWITSVLLTGFMVSEHNCDTIYGFNNKNPQKLVEIVELMLSQRPNESEKKGFGIQKVPQEDGPNYEILITPNKNSQEHKESQKIKIFVEATNFDADERTSPETNKKANGEVAEKRESQNIFDVLPLSIGTMGFNIDQYQQPGHSVVKLSQNNHNYESGSLSDDLAQKDFESYPSKRQTNWGSSQPKTSGGRSSTRQAGIKEVIIQAEPSYVDQNNPYQPVMVTKKEQRVPTYDSDYSSSSQNGKRITQQIYVGEYANPVEEPERTQVRPSPKRTYETTYEEVRPSNDRRPINREPDDVRPSNERRPTYNREEDDYRPSPSRNPGYREPDERRPVYETRPSNEREPTYVRKPEEVRPSNSRHPEYEEVRPSSERRPVYVREEEEVRPSKDRRPPTYEKESTSTEYETRPHDNNRTIREDSSGYSGFPESYQPDVSHPNSRPLQYEPARAFPASPCLNVFKYEGREPEDDRWYADIYVTTDEVLNGMRLDIRLDRPAELLTNWLAEAKTRDGIHFTLLSLTHRLVPGPAETVRIMVKFNEQKPVPYLKSINLNGRLICPSSRAQKTTTRKPIYENPGDLQFKPTTEIYQENSKRPFNYVDGYETNSNTKRTTGHVERRTTPPYEPTTESSRPRPNPNGYVETDQNSFNAPTKKPPGRPSHSNGKPPSHAAKPGGQSNKPGNSQGSSGSSSNKKPSSSSTESRPSQSSSGSNQQGPVVSKKPILCGTPSIQPRPLITHGEATARGQWPWHVALYKNVGADLNFFCGGSLLNTKYVLTAAHCVTESYSMKPLDEKTVVIYLGKYHRKLWSEGGVQNRQISKIHVHPEYNNTGFKSDIAVLALSSPVEYTEYVRPVCLWSRSDTGIEEVEGKVGTVVGWGFDENRQLTEELRQAKMPVVPQNICLWSYPEFYPQFTSNRTYCAGFKNGTSACNGDSGGGMVFPYKDSAGVERWYLRGIVSISPAKPGKVCDSTHYVVFTDVAKYLTWLDAFM